MKVVQINAVCGIGSTGRICMSISNVLNDQGVENYILYSIGSSDYTLGIKYSSNIYIRMQALKSRIFGNYGFNSHQAAKRLIFQLERIQPDIVHLHNIHGHDFNLEYVFRYFKENKTRLVWTFHDCWAFTGYCTHFTLVQCNKWKDMCHNCPQRAQYSWFFDRSTNLYQTKKNIFRGLNLSIITPSKWLAGLVKESFLAEYPVDIINNGIDLTVFRPTASDFRSRNHLESKFIVLGLAMHWNIRKGLDVFVKLAERLNERYQIVLVGSNAVTDKQLPSNVYSIHRTQNAQELAEIYTAADVFVNPTREDNYPTTNMEALACGTPVITFRTGGSPEMLDENCGKVVEYDDVEALIREIVEICETNTLTQSACLNKALEFNAKNKFDDYYRLYRELDCSK